MEKSFFEQMGGTYHQEGDYLLPDLTPPESVPVGIWGQRRRHYLKTHQGPVYIALLLSGELDSHLSEIDRQAGEMFSQLAKQIAEQEGITELLLFERYISQKAINRAVGSVDIVGAARSVLLVARTDREHPNERIMAQVKCNVGPTGNAIVFSVSGGAVQWIEETVKTADEVLGNVFANLGRPDAQMRQAKEVINQLLLNGPTPQREIMDKLKVAGIGESTAKKAKQLMGVRSIKQGAMWFWALPDGDGR